MDPVGDTLDQTAEARRGQANGRDRPAPEPLTAWKLDIIRKQDPPSWILEGILPAKAKTLIFGPSGSYKSTSAAALACAIAHGHDVVGVAPAEALPVLFIVAEDAEGLAANVLAWHEAHELKDGPVRICPADGLALSDPAAAARIAATALKEFGKQSYGLVLDHWDLLAGADLSDANAIQPALATLDALLRHRCRYVILLAHTPWDAPDRMKGSVLAWNNHATRIKAEAEQGALASSLRVVHHKRGRSGLRLSFRWRETDDGIVPAEIGAEHAGPAKKGPSGDKQRLALSCLHRAVAEQAEQHPGHPDIPAHAKLARYGRVEELFVRHAPGEDPPYRKREAFKRAVAGLQSRHLVKHVEGYLWT